MSKYLYNNTVTVPNSGTDTISDGSTVGGDIVKNFKTLAGLISQQSTDTSSGVKVGKGSNSSTGAYSAVVGGTGNHAVGSGTVIAGGYNCETEVMDAVATNSDRSNQMVGGYSFMKSMTIPGYSSYADHNRICKIPSGGMAVLKLQILNPESGFTQECSLILYPGSSGYVSPEYWDSYYVSAEFYYSNGELYIQNTGSGVLQVGVFGTVIGAVSSYSGEGS